MAARLWSGNNPPSRRKGRGGVPPLHKGGYGSGPAACLFLPGQALRIGEQAITAARVSG